MKVYICSKEKNGNCDVYKKVRTFFVQADSTYGGNVLDISFKDGTVTKVYISNNVFVCCGKVKAKNG